jgi:benzodiazapine receptor
MNYLKFVISIGICLSVGFVAGMFTSTSVDTWYPSLRKPFFNPPDWVFGPVWTILYIMMGMALYLVWNSRDKKIAITFFILQLALNFLWSFLFFVLKNPLLAFLEIVLLLVMILLTAWHFHRISKVAGFLLIPYILWVGFASVLNLSIYWLNR